ncbi:MAG: hypothetical protein JSR91_22910 [Proteobacteria bacterium]|nr:hypothetical protein [Pseudomonadota bacterium]
MKDRWDVELLMAVSADQGRSADAYGLPVRHSYVDSICKWILRLGLPAVLGLGGLLFYWVWIDGERTMVFWRVIGMIPLTISFTAIAIWALQAWLPPAEDDRREPEISTARERRPSRRRPPARRAPTLIAYSAADPPRPSTS